MTDDLVILDLSGLSDRDDPMARGIGGDDAPVMNAEDLADKLGESPRRSSFRAGLVKM